MPKETSPYELLPSRSSSDSPHHSSAHLPSSLLDHEHLNRKRRRRWYRSRSKCTAVSLGVLAFMLFVVVLAQEKGYRATDLYSHLQKPPSMPAGLDTTKYRVVTPDDYILPSALTSEPITFIPYTFGYTMLKQTLSMYHHAGWRNIVIIDNSWNRDAWTDEPTLNEQFEGMVTKVVLTTSHLRFAQVMGTMDVLAMSAGAEWFMWSHSDVFVVTPDESDEWELGPWEVVNECTKDVMERLHRGEKVATNLEGGGDAKEETKEEDVTERKLGVLFWRYDWLSVVTVEAAMKAPWDPAMMQYGSDCDRYSRIRRAGYDAIYAKDACPSHRKRLGTLFNMPAPLKPSDLSKVLSPNVSYVDRVSTIEISNNDTDPYAYVWREGDGKGKMGDVDKKQFESYKTGGKGYYEDKWGEEMGGDCVLDGKQPKFDVPVLPGKVVDLKR